MRPALPPFRRALSLLLLAVLGLAPAGCAPEVIPCQAEGTKFRVGTNMVSVWINPIFYVRVYGARVFNADSFSVTVLRNNTMVRRFEVLPFSSEPGGEFGCVQTPVPRMKGSSDVELVTGIDLGTFAESDTGGLSVRIVIRDQTGVTHTLNIPVAELRWRDQLRPMFGCASTACGRYE